MRPHLTYGTVEIRIMDAQSCAGESTALLALATACVAQAALDYDAGRRRPAVPGRLIEENLWRATRHGLDGKLIDLEAEVEIPAVAAVERLLDWTADARDALGARRAPAATCDRMLANGNGAQRQRAPGTRRGADARRSTPRLVAETQATYAEAGTALAVPCGEARA